MRRVIFATAIIFLVSGAVLAQKNMEADLMKMERGAWDAFAKGDSKYFESFLTDDALILMDQGYAGKAASVKDIAGKPCTLKNYDISNFKVTMLNPDTALVTYTATQEGMCGDQKLPAKAYASSIYVNRQGKWMAAFHQETPAM